MTETIEPMSAQIDQQKLAQELVDKARAEGVDLVGPGGLAQRVDQERVGDSARGRDGRAPWI